MYFAKFYGSNFTGVYSFSLEKNKLPIIISSYTLPLTAAIDFSASNGNMVSKSSLHYIHPHLPSLYEQALVKVMPPILPLTNISRLGMVFVLYFYFVFLCALGFGSKTGSPSRLSQCFDLVSSENEIFRLQSVQISVNKKLLELFD